MKFLASLPEVLKILDVIRQPVCQENEIIIFLLFKYGIENLKDLQTLKLCNVLCTIPKCYNDLTFLYNVTP